MALGCSLLLGACTTLGPDYQTPKVEWLERWQTNLYGLAEDGEVRREVDLRFWWQAFHDPVLNALVAEARRSNPTLRIAGLRVFEGRALLGIAGAGLYPQLQQFGGAITYVNSKQHGGAGESRSFVSYDPNFALSWVLDFWGRFRRSIESADAAFFSSVAAQQDAQVLLTAEVADLYYAWRTVLARIEIARSNAEVQRRSFEITRAIFESGGSSELDMQQARTQYLSTLSTIPQLEIVLANARNALSALLGRSPGDLPELEGVGGDLPETALPVVGELPASLLLLRPDVRAAAWRTAAQSAQIGIAETDFYPAISLLGNLGWSGTSAAGAADTSTLVFGPSLRWNIFDHGRIRNNVRLQDVRMQTLIESYQRSVLQAAREVDSAAVSVIKGSEQRQLVDEAVKAAARALELANRQYQEGFADFQRVLTAQTALAAQTERRIVTHGEQISAVIRFYKSLGGGWTFTPAEELIPPVLRRTMEERTDWGELLTAPIPRPRPATIPPTEVRQP